MPTSEPARPLESAQLRSPAARKSPAAITAAIVAAAIEVIGEEGVRGATHRAVAARAGVSLSSTTYHFASRERILAAATDAVAAYEVAACEALIAQLEADLAAGLDSPATWLADALTAWVRAGEREQLRAAYELQLYAATEPAMQPTVRRWIDEAAAHVARGLALVGSAQPDADARLVVAAAEGARLELLTTPDSAAALARVRETFERLAMLIVPSG